MRSLFIFYSQENITAVRGNRLVNVTKQVEQLSHNGSRLSYADVKFTANILSNIAVASKAAKTPEQQKEVSTFLIIIIVYSTQ